MARREACALPSSRRAAAYRSPCFWIAAWISVRPSIRGASLSWESSTGPAHPAYFEREGLGWLRTFHGGLLATCGMTYAGAPTVDEGVPLGLHGRINHTPASNVWADGSWRGDEYEMWVRGRMRETVVFGENITLTRRISAPLGEARLLVRDVVVNEGFQTTPHMMLYHCNFGFPLLAEGSELLTPSKHIAPRDSVAAPGLPVQGRYEAPVDGYKEQVFYHDMAADGEGYVTVLLANRAYDSGQGLGDLPEVSPGGVAALYPVEERLHRHLCHRPGAGQLPGGRAR